MKGREMRVLATGMNPVDSNTLRRMPRVAIFQVFPLITGALREDGNEVDWRRIRVGDPIPPGTDAVILSCMLPRSLNCPYALGVMWTMSEALRLDIPLVLYLTDWQFFNAAREYKSVVKEGAGYFFKQIGGSPQYAEPYDEVVQHSDELLAVCEAYSNPGSRLWRNAQILVPRFTYIGDVKIVQRMLPGANPVHTVDPTPSFLDYLDSNPKPSVEWPYEQRARRWILPSLVTDTTWMDRQQLSWPVDRFGSKGYIVLEDEREVQNAYARRLGSVCPPYPTAGGGWWRSRWIHSAIAGSVTLCDTPDEINDSYRFNGEQYESMSIDRLKEVALEQSDIMSIKMQKNFSIFREQVYAPFRRMELTP
jgi:hypothetical protein